MKWAHQESNLRGVSDAALARAASGDWSSGTMADRVRELRALVVRSAIATASLTGMAAPPDGDALTLDGLDDASFPTLDHAVLAGAIGQCCRGLSRDASPASPLVTTTEGQDAQTEGWFVAIIVIAAVAAGGVAMVYLGEQAASVIDRQLERETQAKKLATSLGAAVTIAENHARAEAQAGKPIAMSETERAAIAAVKSAAEAAGAPLPERTPSVSPPTFPALGSGLVTAAAAAVALYFVAT